MTVAPDAHELELPRQPGAIRGLMRRHPRWVDGFIAGCYLLGTAGLAALRLVAIEMAGADVVGDDVDYGHWPNILRLLLGMGVTATALLLRRRFPLSSLVAVLLVLLAAPDDMLLSAGASVASWVLLYSVPVYRSAKAGWVGYGAAVVASLLPIPSMIGDPVSADLSGPGGAFSVAITSALMMLIPVVIGINAGNRNRYTEAIIDRAHQLARERDQLARLAVAEERSRIAREMHDIVAHSVSVMIMLSEGASRAAAIQPEAAAKAMEQCAETGRSALGEMRRLIGALREPDAVEAAELEPTPGVEALPELIDGFRAAGLQVDLTLKGAPRVADGAAGQGRELAIYRTVQEALTNTLRHAGRGAAATVLIDQRGGSTVVRVTDDGGPPGQAAPMSGVGSGQGLIGLAERVRVFGGELDYGPDGARGWRVTATLPDGERPADELRAGATAIEFGSETRDD
ncbi:sensor histidine kinase [Tessaracoccus caeni]|uniref:sensor histidine kinase n=1 Tax=Tessaracoccus caeni TaxID=3031239 RepID=UPI0023D9BD8F|nr:histidine kinase [Tessaracoccus caeni]MDF1488737.1 histidine kinase [Tessaracoccus caeni]